MLTQSKPTKLCKCDECSLSGPKVLSQGTSDAEIMFIGEAPGRVEVQTGVPFSGPSGEVLDLTLQKLEIPRDICYVTNLCLCPVPDNEDPLVADVRACWNRLSLEIQEVNPKVLVALGKVPTGILFDMSGGFMNTRGIVQQSKAHRVQGIGTYHPAALLYPKGANRFPEYWVDMSKMARVYRGEYTQPEPDTDTFVVSHSSAERVLDRIHQDAEVIAYDWETTGLDPRTAEGWCLGMSWRPGTAVVWPQDVFRAYIPELCEIFERDDLIFVAYNAPFDTSFNKREGLPPRADFDPLVLHMVLDERPQNRSLERRLVEDLDWPPYESQMLRKFNVSKAEMIKRIPKDIIYDYCGKDCDGALRLYYLYRDAIDKESPRFMPLVQGLLDPAHYMLKDVSDHGIHVDQEQLTKIETLVKGELDVLEEKVNETLETIGFNPRSHKQVQSMLWDTLELPEPKLYNRKKRSANADTLEYLQENNPHPFVDLLIEHREKQTLYSRYLKALWRHIKKDGRVHPYFNLGGAETGRLSASDPPIQQIPKRPEIRAIFAATPGWKMIRADYSQVEIRAAAYYSDEPFLIQLFKDGLDFHTVMAVMAKGNIPQDVDLKDYIRTDKFRAQMEVVTPDERNAAKGVSFGLLYGMGDTKLAMGTGLPSTQATIFVQNYKRAMPSLQRWIKRTHSAIRNQHYVESALGRRRRFPFVTEDNLDELEREAVNMPIQSIASDILLDAAVRCHRLFRTQYKGKAHLLALIHDEMIVECIEGLETEIITDMSEIMTSVPLETEIPFPAEFKIGDNWGYGEEVVPE